MASSSDVDWAAVVHDVADQLGAHRRAGRSHLLTEDTVRMCTILALEHASITPDRLRIEVPVPVLAGGKIDLAVDGLTGVVIELKYPRGSRTGISPDTMTAGELLRDFLRVALVDANDRWVIQVIDQRLKRYLTNFAARHGFTWAFDTGNQMAVERDVLAGLPKTSLDAIGSIPWRLPVRGICVLGQEVDDGLTLFAYRVAAPAQHVVGESLTARTGEVAPLTTGLLPQSAVAPVRAVGGARAEILHAIRSITTRSGRAEVTIQDVLNELRRTGSRYAESTISTMMSSHLCAQAQGPGVDPFTDLDRVGRGIYRLRRSDVDDPV